MLTLTRLTLLSTLRQPPVLAAFLVIPAVLVFLTADAFDKFSSVLGVGMHDMPGHGAHFAILSGLWAAGITAAMISALTVTEALRADSVLALKHSAWRWALARGATLIGVGMLAVLVSIGFVAIREDGTGVGVWLAAAYNTALYVLVGQLVAYFARDAIAAVGCVSSLWIVDALLAPSMTEGTWWQPVLSPWYSAEYAAMGYHLGGGEIAALVVWPLLLVTGFVAVFRLRPRAPELGFGAAASTAVTKPSRAHGLRLLLVDLLRHRALLGFAVAGPLCLMASSLWLFRGVHVAVPAMEHGHRVLLATTMPQLHAAYMGMIAVVSFSGTAGFLIAIELHGPDGRLGRNFGRLGAITILRLGTLLAVGTVATLAALVLVAAVRQPEHWGWFILAHLLAGWTFTFLGYCVGLLLDRVTGILLMMFFPFVDVGIAQDYMLGPALPRWAVLLPSHPFAQLSISSSFGDAVFDTGYLAWGVGILAVSAVAVAAVSGRRLRRAEVA
ncbi:hypothetical protein [Nocardia sp. NBC_00511]|uniref:hypothetical protein n=1 Tax=Nocardia sp. NBC_00511 TaxID=2903591 RepID=UPI0030DFA060